MSVTSVCAIFNDATARRLLTYSTGLRHYFRLRGLRNRVVVVRKRDETDLSDEPASFC